MPFPNISSCILRYCLYYKKVPTQTEKKKEKNYIKMIVCSKRNTGNQKAWYAGTSQHLEFL